MDQRSRVKFKIMSLKVKGPMDYVPELFDEQKDDVSKEHILRIIFLDPERPNPESDFMCHAVVSATILVLVGTGYVGSARAFLTFRGVCPHQNRLAGVNVFFGFIIVWSLLLVPLVMLV